MEICPICKRAQLTLHLGGYLGKVYRCSNCDYVGPVVIEMAAEDYRRMLREFEND
ncbi:MAG: TFIIB-type zinc ribbon-containing protein [Nitrososphaerota archaeon]